MEKSIEVFKWIVAIVGGFIAGALGGMDNLLIFYVVVICADVVAGTLKGAKQKNFSSSILFWGLVNKAFELCIVALMERLDIVLGLNALRNIFIIWFCICNVASIVENSAVIGVPWPDGLQKILVQVRKGFSINISKIVKKIIEEYMPIEESESDKNED